MHHSHNTKRLNNGTGKPGSSAVKLGFMDLPLETQKEIVKHVRSSSDLASIQRVSRHFHRLASAKLYGHLLFLLAHGDSSSFYGKSSSRLADALHIFATSEHDYGMYVKSFTIQLSDKDPEDLQRRVLSKYHWEEEATKLLNTALLLMLRKTRTLEVFSWDASIELDGYVYDALSKIESLHELVIRLDTRAVPRITTFAYPPTASQLSMPPPPPGQFGQPTQTSYSTGFSTSSTSLPMLARQHKANPHLSWSGKRKFSSFKDLRNLQISGIDNLDCLPEIATCMKACSASLKSLNISLSLELARRARKPTSPSPPINQTADALDDEDEDDMTPPPEPAVVINPPHVNEADIKREKAIQDSILAKIFGLEPTKAEDKKVDRALKATAATLKTKENPDEIFLEEMKKIMTKLIQTKAVGYKGLLNDKNILKLLEKDVDKYLQSSGHKSKKAKSMTTSASLKLPPLPSSMPPHPSQAGPSHSSLPQQEWKFAYQTFQDLMGSDQPSPSEFESFMLANAGHLPSYTSSYAPPMSYYVDKVPGFGGSSSSTIPKHHSQHGNHYHPYSGSTTGHHHYHTNNPSSMFPGLGKASNPATASYQIYKQGVYDKAMQDEEDHAIQEMLLESATKAEEQADADSESEASEPDVAKGSNADGGEEEAPAIAAPIFPAGQANPLEQEDEMDVDMDHPDIIDSETDDEQGMRVGDTLAPDPVVEHASSTASPYSAVSILTDSVLNGSGSNGKQAVKIPSPVKKLPPKRNVRKTKSVEETMQEYIRTKHGFHIEALKLYLVPLKPSVIGRALDLSCLRELTLLNVGQQGSFWSFVDKIQKESIPINLRHIHTDDVSMAFLNCVANISGLEDLFMMRRAAKDGDFTSSTAPASLASIRVIALRKHISTLRKLMIVNNEDETWDLDAKTLRLVTAKGTALTELAFSVSVSEYHIFMQGIRGLRSLVAMHILAIRTNDTCQTIGRESRKFTIDNITHCPELKIRYLAMSNIVFELARKPKPRKARLEANGKGKGKATEELSADSDDFSEIEGGGLEMACVKHLKFSEVPSVTIFRKEIRTGRL